MSKTQKQTSYTYIFWSIVVPALAIATLNITGFPQISDVYAGVVERIRPLGKAQVVFVGDVMLGRHVEEIAFQKGWPHIFQNTKELFDSADVVVGNLEGVIQSEHTRTPNEGLRFSFETIVGGVLKENGFTHLSLANNHTLDFGIPGYFQTRQHLYNAGLESFGDPRDVAAARTVTVDGIHIGFIGIHGLVDIKDGVAERMVREAKDIHDTVVVFVHWGNEYQGSSHESQQELARALIDSGADAVIGHHPHVIQEVEVYKEKIIFYSLGNFIFDQYFSPEVEQGLLVRMYIDGKDITYELIPLISESSVIRKADNEERSVLLESVAEKSSGILQEQIKTGAISDFSE